MLGGEVPGGALRLVVDDEVDVALAVQRDVFRAVLGDFGEAELLEDGLEDVALGGCELDELEARESHRIFEEISHFSPPESVDSLPSSALVEGDAGLLHKIRVLRHLGAEELRRRFGCGGVDDIPLGRHRFANLGCRESRDEGVMNALHFGGR